ncbi:MAG: thioesterase family protein, partial [Piscinibacter sp.]|nr:thioesterase family protein [Piscinibacter sp.]
ERFELHTRIVHWDERWFYFQHDFYRARDPGRPVCTAYVTTLFMGRQGVVGTDVVVPALAGRALAPPPLGPDVRAIFRLDAAA